MEVFCWNWKELQVEHLLRAQTLMAILLSVPPCSNGVIPLKPSSFFSHSGPHHFRWSLTLRRAGEYVCAMRAFALLTPTLASSKTIIVLQVFHPLDLSLPCSNSLMEFKLKADLDFSLDMFMLTFIHSIHLLVG
jgi:hypothetical protein